MSATVQGYSTRTVHFVCREYSQYITFLFSSLAQDHPLYWTQLEGVHTCIEYTCTAPQTIAVSACTSRACPLTLLCVQSVHSTTQHNTDGRDDETRARTFPVHNVRFVGSTAGWDGMGIRRIPSPSPVGKSQAPSTRDDVHTKGFKLMYSIV